MNFMNKQTNTMKKINYYLVIIFLSQFSFPVKAQFTQGKPQVVTTKYSDWDVPVVSYDASLPPYNADKTGVSDATFAIQSAMNDCAAALGGIVYLPEGQYRINGNLVWKEGVTLRGDWKKPTDVDKSVKGTVLCIYNSKAIPDADSPILLASGTGIRDLSIFYPEQNANSPVAYPYTIRCKGQLQTVQNISLINSYQGVRYEPDSLTIGYPNMRNVYGSPLYKGVRLNKAAAVPRISNVHFSPQYWALSGLTNAPTQLEILTCIRSMNSVGIEFANSDNGIIGNLEISGYDTGIFIGALDNGTAGQSNMKLYDFNISKCRVGINADVYKIQGWAFSKGAIDVDGINCIALSQSSDDALIFDSCSFKSTGVLINSESGALGFTKCDFLDWQDTNAITKKSGNLMVSGCRFIKPQALSSTQNHIYMYTGVLQAAISGNIYLNNTPKIISENKNYTNIVIDYSSSNTGTDPQLETYQFAVRPLPSKIDNASLFNVKDYGAKGDIVTDNTSAFRAALKAAEKNGGGTVYVPGGAYRVNGNLIIPSGVELRGVHDLPAITDNIRSILLSYLDLSKPGDSAFISLNQNSGVRGLLIYRPQQKYNELKGDSIIYDLPYIIRATGSNCWVQNVVIPNANNGIDFNSVSGGGHFIDFYFATPLGNCLSVLAGVNPSKIENMQTNPVYFRGIRGALDWSLFNSSSTISNGIKYTAPLATEYVKLYPRGTACNVYGDGSISFYANFYNSPFKGFIIKGSPKMVSLLSGGEGDNFYEVASAGDIDLKVVANTYHPIEMADASFGMFDLSASSKAKISIINTISFASPNTGYKINNGQLLIQSGYQTVTLNNFVIANGNAVVKIENMFQRGGCALSHAFANDQASVVFQGSISTNSYLISNAVELTGCSPITKKIITAGVVENNTGNDGINIYPNPSNGVVKFSSNQSIELSNLIKVQIFDLNGRKIFTSEINPNSDSIDVSSYSKGMYIISIDDGLNRISKKLVIM